MNVLPLGLTEGAKLGATHLIKITFADLTDTAGLTKALQIIPTSGNLAAGWMVRNVKAKVKVAFVGCATLGMEVGDAGSVARNLASFDMKSTAGTWKTIQPTTTSPSVFAAAGHVDALFTATTNNLSLLTAGELWILVDMVNLEAVQQVKG